MSLTARMLLAYARELRDHPTSIHAFSWNHCVRVLARHLIGEGA